MLALFETDTGMLYWRHVPQEEFQNRACFAPPDSILFALDICSSDDITMDFTVRLPVEVLSDIFVIVVEPDTVYWLDLFNRRRDIVFVCRRWRVISTSLPTLWSRLYVARPVLPRFISFSVENAGPRTDLVVEINPHAFEAIYDKGYLRELECPDFDKFLQCSVAPLRDVFHRVRSLNVSSGTRSEVYTVMDLVATFSASRLSNLGIDGGTHSRGTPPSMPLDMRLTSLSLRSLPSMWSPSGLYRSLTKLSLQDFYNLQCDELRTVLHRNATLVDLRLSDVHCSGWSAVSQLRATVPHVTHLALEYRRNTERGFLKSILLPALESLSVELDGHKTIPHIAYGMEAFMRSASEIWLEAHDLFEDELADVVAFCTGARLLNMRCCRPLPYPSLFALTTRPNFSMPNLQLLKIAGDLTEEEALTLVSYPFPPGVVISEWVFGAADEFREWKLENEELCIDAITEIRSRVRGAMFSAPSTPAYRESCRPAQSFHAWMDHTGFFDYSRFGGTEYEQDWEEPLLSVYNYAAIRILQGRPYDASWQAVLSTINPVSLYKLSLTSETMFALIMAHVRAVQPASGSSDEHLAGSPQDRLSSLPNEVLSLVLARLNLAARLSLHRTCRKMAALCGRELQAGVSRVLTRFGLCHAEIRFMQSTTMAAIGGHCIPHMVDYESLPEQLIFYAPNVSYQSVLRFFTLSTGREATPLLLNNLYLPEGYDDCADFEAAGNPSRSFRVVRSITNSALDSITYSPFTHLFGAVTHLGLWLGYPDSSINGVTMPNRDCIDFEDPATEDRVISSFEHFNARFSLEFHLNEPHQCGYAWGCPTTPRSTADAGCLSLFFPALPSGTSFKPDTVYPTPSCMPWTLGSRACPQGAGFLIAKDGIRELRQRFDSYEKWKLALIRCIARPPYSPISFMDEYPLLDRLRADVFSANKMFLANAVHGLDFAATRDRTFQGAACWSFKRYNDFDVNRECPWRFPVRPYETNVFGRVDFIENHESGSIVRLGRPTGVSCHVQRLFDKQFIQLQRMVEEDHDHSGTVATADWFSPSFAGCRYSRQDGCFYVSIGRFVGASTAFKVGDNLELEASFRFTQADHKRYTVSVMDIWSLADDEIGKRGSDSFPRFVSSSAPRPAITGPMSNYTQEYIQSAKRSLAFIRYPDDLVATRDRSSAAGSSFSFKDLTVNTSQDLGEPGVVWPGRGKRGSEKRFQCNIFGEVRSAVTMEHTRSVSVELGRPAGATCAVVELWREQLRALREIVEGDSVDVFALTTRGFKGGTCRGSWFALGIDVDYRPLDTFWVNFVAAPTNNYSAERMYRDLVDMMKAGQLIDALVWFQRFDISQGPGKALALNYYAAARRVTRLPVDAVSRKRHAYTCDEVFGWVFLRQGVRSPFNKFRSVALMDCVLSVLLSDFTTSTAELTLAESAVGERFAATRDRSEGPDSIFSYKILDYEQEAGLFARGELETYTPSLFGEVDAITRGENAYIKIKCPNSLRCSVKKKYWGQMAQLKATVDLDNIQLGGRVGSSWFADEANGMMPDDGCAYIRPWGGDAAWEFEGVVPGTLIGSWAQLLRKDSGSRDIRRDYKLRASFFVVAVPDRALPLAIYKLDFDALRERSCNKGSLYCYKRIPEVITEGEIECREVQWTYKGSVFGQVVEVYEMEPDIAAIRLKCPVGAPCSLIELWDMQCRVLKNIMEVDEMELGGRVGTSFLRCEYRWSPEDDEEHTVVIGARSPGGLYNGLGDKPIIIAVVKILRIDKDEHASENVERSGATIGPNDAAAVYGPKDGSPLRRKRFPLQLVAMLARLKADRAGSLAKAVYNRHFFAVRDRTEGTEGVYTFKSGKPIGIDSYSEERQELAQYTALAFGEVRQVYLVVGCPKGATCNGTNMFRRQLATLRGIIETDEISIPGDVVDSWFGVVNEEVLVPHRTGSFYVVLRPGTESEDLAVQAMCKMPDAVGSLWLCTLGFERRHFHRAPGFVVKVKFTSFCSGYELGVTEVALCEVDDIPRMGVNYSCDIHFGLSCKICSKIKAAQYVGLFRSNLVSSFTMLLLQHLERAGRLALTAVQYGIDFGAIRNGSRPGGDEYTFVEDNALDLSPRKSRLGVRVNILVGEFDYISPARWCGIEDSCRLLCVRIRPPTNSTDDAQDVYQKQLFKLREILSLDGGQDDAVGDSWFDMSADFPGCGPLRDCFYVGDKALADGFGENIGNTRNYFMFAMDYQLGEFPVHGTSEETSGGIVLLRDIGARALAFARYKEDFLATRETSAEGQDLYTFKAVGDNLDVDGEHKGRLERFTAVVFGEIVDVFEDEHHFGIVVRCPTNATCNCRDIFDKQVDCLATVMALDEEDEISCYAFSEGKAQELRDHYMTPESKGKIVCCTVQLDRADSVSSQGLVKIKTRGGECLDRVEEGFKLTAHIAYDCQIRTFEPDGAQDHVPPGFCCQLLKEKILCFTCGVRGAPEEDTDSVFALEEACCSSPNTSGSNRSSFSLRSKDSSRVSVRPLNVWKSRTPGPQVVSLVAKKSFSYSDSANEPGPKERRREEVARGAAQGLQPTAGAPPVFRLPLPLSTMLPLVSEMRLAGVSTLAFSGYGEDFYATRESSSGGGDFYTFKNVIEWDPEYECRGRAERFVPLLFGEVKDVSEVVGDNLVILLACPKRATCNARDLFDRQVRALERILEVDDVDFPGEITTSWFADTPRVGMNRRSFRVLCKASSKYARDVLLQYENIEARGGLLGCHVALERSNFEEAGEIKKVYEMWALQLRAEPEPPSSVKVGYQWRMKTDRATSLALTKYGETFFSTRDSSDGDGSDCVFSFKKGSDALITADNGAFCVLLGCPKDGSCDAKKTFLSQIPTLKSILEMDEVDFVIIRPHTDEEAAEFVKLFDEDAVGKILECSVEFERRHWNTSEGLVKTVRWIVLVMLRSGLQLEGDCGPPAWKPVK
ncbi:hypothetical protein B0H16DRAFT_1484095 [Mycena metata]|uniref:F-box domain-containing protein n=1 Tax=Mycena metata TaxID=1033252 RepID=A0AAD7GQD6_9AGAR|nr:hypothetical protein B0H16DRAFT_1484095 [Mycena metata]